MPFKKLLSGLKNVCKSLMKHFKGFSSGFTKLHMKLYVETLLNFAIHRRQNGTQSKKSTHIKTKHSQRGVMWQTMQ
jgi:hypothetical protein